METQTILRRTQVERRQRTQELLLDVAIELLFERGSDKTNTTPRGGKAAGGRKKANGAE